MFLPRLHRSVGYALKPVRASTIQRAALGGSLTPLNRVGDHWQVEVDVGAMGMDCSRALLADIVRGVGQRIRVMLPQDGLSGGPFKIIVPHSDGTFFSDGAGYASGVRVLGDGQSGAALNVAGLDPDKPVGKGRMLTVDTPTGPTAHIVTETVSADADGEAAIPLWPMLWRQPADLDRVELDDPYLEGFITDSGSQSTGLLPLGLTDAFVIEEG